HPHYGKRVAIGPAEAPPHLEAGFLLFGVIRHARGARWMQPDRQIKLRHRGEDRLESFLVERAARNISENLNASGAELLDRAARLLHRAFYVRHRQRGDKSWEAVGIARTQLGHGVVADAREVEPGLAGGKVLDRRIGQRDDLPIIAELVHLTKPLVKIEQLFDAA